tara:strand:+ start:690 stop:986 length:297 start_codon:yes stop_codon:yes gene_type:complete
MILLNAAGTGWSSLIMFGMIFIVMYLFMIRPQIKKQKKEREYRLALKKGDKIVTIGGIHGKITDIKEHSIIIDVNAGTSLKVEKSAISMSGEVIIEKK